MIRLIMMKGLPGSGKSTYAKELVNSGFARINKDDMREMFHNSKYSRSNEEFILKMRDEAVRALLSSGKSVVVDDTNFEPKHAERLSKLAQMYGAIFEEKFIDTPFEKCVEQDLKRYRSVGEKVIRRMYNKYLRVIETPKKANRDCYVFDIDGTLALMNGRSPYDESLVSADKVSYEVATLNAEIQFVNVILNGDLEIILMSGRHESCREDTEKWLDKNDIQYDHLYMRATDDGRQDSIVKSEMYEKYINGTYNVLGWFDDRDRVVKAMRDKGIKVFQVAEGDF